jgi:hypothetical protein
MNAVYKPSDTKPKKVQMVKISFVFYRIRRLYCLFQRSPQLQGILNNIASTHLPSRSLFILTSRLRPGIPSSRISSDFTNTILFLYFSSFLFVYMSTLNAPFDLAYSQYTDQVIFSCSALSCLLFLRLSQNNIQLYTCQ